MNEEYRDIYDLHKKYACGPYKEKWIELVWTHSNIVLEISQIIKYNYELKNNTLINNEDLIKGILLHDIGVYKCFNEDFNANETLPKYINHGFIGAEIIKYEKYPPQIQRFAVTHTATGFTKQDVIREKLNYPIEDYIPSSIEEEILCFADKFHSKYPKFTNIYTEIEKLSLYDPNRKIKMQYFINKFGIPDLTAVKDKYYKWHQSFEEWFKSKSL